MLLHTLHIVKRIYKLWETVNKKNKNTKENSSTRKKKSEVWIHLKNLSNLFLW